MAKKVGAPVKWPNATSDISRRLQHILPKLSCEEIGEKIGRSHDTIRRYLAGKREVPIKDLEKMTAITGGCQQCLASWVAFGIGKTPDSKSIKSFCSCKETSKNLVNSSARIMHAHDLIPPALIELYQHLLDLQRRTVSDPEVAELNLEFLKTLASMVDLYNASLDNVELAEAWNNVFGTFAKNVQNLQETA